MASNGTLRGLALRLAYFSGTARVLQVARGGAGAILRFERVRPPRRDAFQPLRSSEITPERLDRLCGAIRRWGFEVVSMDEAIRRAGESAATGARFVVLTFDGAYRDLATYAAPVLARHQLPYSVFVPTGFVDGIAPIWWLALEQVIVRHERVSLVVERVERHFDIARTRQKYELFGFLDGWLRTLPQPDLVAAINDLCRRYSVDLIATSRAAAMQWSDLRALARDPLVTVGSATVDYPVLSVLRQAEALRQMRMGRQVAETALDRDVPHFAYPFGDARAVGRREIGLAQDAGFASAVTAQSGIVRRQDGRVPYALPRLSWAGSWRTLRVLMAGFGDAPVKPT